MEDRKKKVMRFVALAGVAFLVIMVLATLVVACVDFDGSDKIFKGLIGMDIAIPCILWIYITIYRIAHKADKSFEEEANAEIDKEQNKES